MELLPRKENLWDVVTTDRPGDNEEEWEARDVNARATIALLTTNVLGKETDKTEEKLQMDVKERAIERRISKRTTKGKLKTYKAPLVAKGYSQKFSEDFDEVFAPATFRTLLTVAQKNGFVENEKKDWICKLQKSIYGLKQAARAWNDKTNEKLISFGFRRGKSDCCLYSRQEENGWTYLLIMYVDDLLLTKPDKSIIAKVAKQIGEEMEIKCLGLWINRFLLSEKKKKTARSFPNVKEKSVNNVKQPVSLSELNFLAIEIVDGNFSKISPFLISRSIRNIAGDLNYLPKVHRARSATGLRKGSSRNYNFKKGTEIIQLCKNVFLKTLSISHGPVDHALNGKNENGMFDLDDKIESDPEYNTLRVFGRGRSADTPKNISLLYKGLLSIPEKKKNSLLKLCSNNIIPPEYHGWYKSISADNKRKATIREPVSFESNSDIEIEELNEFLVLSLSNVEVVEEEGTELCASNAYKPQVGTMTIRTIKKLRKVIAAELNKSLRTILIAANYENRWGVIDRTHKKFVDNKKTGRVKKVFEYVTEMKEIFGKKNSIHPDVVLSVETVDVPATLKNDKPALSTSEIDEPVPSTSRNYRPTLFTKPKVPILSTTSTSSDEAVTNNQALVIKHRDKTSGENGAKPGRRVKASHKLDVSQFTLEDRVRNARKNNLTPTKAAAKKLGRFNKIFNEEQEKKLVEFILIMEQGLFGLTLENVRELAFEQQES
ncbi:hypothetical protein ILUMI_06154 [Ignelater luminosus]|uniref:Reverse transcriptase Ty1/copia-type domain-containing protein n=1 Tax=Ignelater luminosus TaxID=2038154 RepID=A0A8K0D5U1_IGNLU|nr:hypothetical protein ILUMI_06154 [Ignelater luminosus]